MENLDLYQELYLYALDLAIINPVHLNTGFLRFYPQNGIENIQAEELMIKTRHLLLDMVNQLAANEELDTYVNQLEFGMMFQYCFDKGVELMYHSIKGTFPIPTTFYVPDSMTNEGPDIPSQYKPSDDVIFKLGSIFHDLKEYCKHNYPESVGTEEYLFCFFRIATALGFLYGLEIKM